MGQKRKILYVIDSYRREQRGAVALSNSLKSFGFLVVLCDRRGFRQAFERVSPDAVLLPKLHKIPAIGQVDLSRAKLYLLSAESFTGSRAAIRAYFHSVVPDDILPRLSGIFCWGQTDYEEITDLVSSSEIALYLTGHPNTDAWYRKPPPTGETDARRGFDRRVVGITTSLRALTHAQRPHSAVELIASLEDSGESGFYDPPNHSEIWIAYEASIIRIIHNLAGSNPLLYFKIRVHPNENLHDYLAFRRLHSNVAVSQGGDFFDWADGIDVLLSAYSTSMLDGAIHGKPVYSLTGLIPDFINERMPRAIADMELNRLFPELTATDLSDIMTDAYDYRESGVSTFLRSTFNFPSAELPSETIARTLDGLVEVGDPVFRRRDGDSNRRFHWKRFAYLDKLYSLYWDARNRFRDDPYFKPHRFIRNRRIRKQAQSGRYSFNRGYAVSADKS